MAGSILAKTITELKKLLLIVKGEEREAFPSRRLSREMSLLFQGGMGFQLVKNHSLPVPGQANPGFQGINPHGVPAALASAGFHMQL